METLRQINHYMIVFAHGKVDHGAQAKVDRPVELLYGRPVAAGQDCGSGLTSSQR